MQLGCEAIRAKGDQRSRGSQGHRLPAFPVLAKETESSQTQRRVKAIPLLALCSTVVLWKHMAIGRTFTLTGEPAGQVGRSCLSSVSDTFLMASLPCAFPGVGPPSLAITWRMLRPPACIITGGSEWLRCRRSRLSPPLRTPGDCVVTFTSGSSAARRGLSEYVPADVAFLSQRAFCLLVPRADLSLAAPLAQ